MKTAEKSHPLLKELQISEKAAKDGLTAMEILNHLLHNGHVSPDALKSAHATLRQEKAQSDGHRVAPNDNSNELTIRTRHVALEIFYDGEKYSGLAENVGQEADQSVERALFQALQKCRFITNRESANYSRCGRTDKGVSAAGQVVALHVKSAFGSTASWDAEGQDLVQDDQLPKNSLDAKTVWVPPRKPKKGGSGSIVRQQKDLTEFAYDHVLNNLLPPEIRVLGWTPVSDDFSARFSAGSRTYRYFFHRRHMSIENMRDGLVYMVGTHDFRNLCKLNVEEVSNFERRVHEARIVPLEDGCDELYRLEIMGQAFLWHQIRCIVSVLFMIGKGLEEPEVVQELLDVQKHPGKPAYPLADERPLVLHDCAYPNLHFGYTMRNLWTVTCHQERRWEDLVLAAARIRNSLDKMGAFPLQVSDVQRFCHDKLELRRKKADKRGHSEVLSNNGSVLTPFQTERTTWKEALQWVATFDLFPEPDSTRDKVHTPLLQRSKGTSYEEKVASLQKNTKRKSRYDENINKKRKSKEEDQEFYHHKAKQGGSAF